MTTTKYRPSNGSEGDVFQHYFCDRCKREAKFRETQDGADGCPIVLHALVYEEDDPKYPAEWVYDNHDVTTARCTAFEAEGDASNDCT